MQKVLPVVLRQEKAKRDGWLRQILKDVSEANWGL